MKVTRTALPEVLLIEPRVFADARGAFHESYHEARYAAAGVPGPFVQDNVSVSRAGVLRGLHLQEPHAQGKLVSVLHGAVYDVAADVRVGSPTFGRWVGQTLSADNRLQLYVPPGFAHGFLVLSDEAVFSYKCSDVYHGDCEVCVRWDDPTLAIAWPAGSPLLSEKDAAGLTLDEAAHRELLPRFHPSPASVGS